MKTVQSFRTSCLTLIICCFVFNASLAQDKKPAILMVHGLAGDELRWKDFIENLPVDQYEYCGNFDIPVGSTARIGTPNFDSGIERIGYPASIEKYKIYTLHFHDNVGLDFKQQGRRTRMVVDWIVNHDTTDVVLVAHSMGGLASRACIMENPANIVGLVTATTPHVGSYCGLVNEYYENNKLTFSEDEQKQIDAFVNYAHSQSLGQVNEGMLRSYAAFWNDIQLISGQSLLYEMAKNNYKPFQSSLAEAGNFILPAVHDNLKLNSPAVKYLIPYSDQMKELYDQEFPVDIPVGVVLSKWDQDLYIDVDQNSQILMSYMFPFVPGVQIKEVKIENKLTDLGRNVISFVPEALRMKYSFSDRNVYPLGGQYFDYTDGIVTVYSQDIRNGIKNGEELTNIGFFGTNKFHTNVIDDFGAVQDALNFVLNAKKTGGIKVGLILDSSGSMSSSDPNNVRISAAEAIIDILEDDAEAFIVDFDNSGKFLNSGKTLIGDASDLKSLIRTIDASGGTDVGSGIMAMKEAIQSGNSINYRKTGVILLTDGQGNYADEAAWFIQNNIPIYTISYKQFADANLMNKIAFETGGIYRQVNSKDDVVNAFMHFYYGVSGNSNIFREEVYAEGPYETGNIYIDETATEMILYLDNLDIDASLIEVISPAGSKLLSDISDVVKGANYVFARMKVEGPGFYNVRIDQNVAYHYNDVIGHSKGGPSFENYPVPASSNFIIEVSTNTKKKVDLQMAENAMGTYDLKFRGDEGDISMKESSAELEVTSPSGTVRKYSKGYSNGKMSFIPLEGKGSYTLDIDFRAKDTGGHEVKRRYVRSLLVGDVQPGYMGSVNRKMGNYIYTEQGLYTQNREGITAEVFSQGSDLTNPVAKGYVTSVKEQSCIIELQEISSEVKEGDIVILNLIQWKGDH